MDPARVALLGAGEMGNPLCRNLLAAGFEVTVFDPDPARLAEAGALGARAGDSAAGAAAEAGTVLTSLPSAEHWMALMEDLLVPAADAGQLFVDLGTSHPSDTRRFAAALAAKGAALVDAPVSGGPAGARDARLFVFAGGDRAAFDRARPVLAAACGPDRITYCGPPGAGQIVKGVNQLAMGLSAAAFLEALAYADRMGLAPAVAADAIAGKDSPEPWRTAFAAVARAVAAGQGRDVGVKYRELPYYLREAEAAGFELPLTALLRARMEAGPVVVTDDHRPAPAWWERLTGS